MKNIKQFISTLKNNKGFTLVELIIVLAILGGLAVVLLLTINPSEAQKKTRDTKRLKDIATLQTIIEQYLADGGEFVANKGGCESGGEADTIICRSDKVPAAGCKEGNWLGPELCKYASSVPLDPANGTTRSFVKKGPGGKLAFGTGKMYYQVVFRGSDYEINVRQEAGTNSDKVFNDGGCSDEWVEAGSDLKLFSGDNCETQGTNGTQTTP